VFAQTGGESGDRVHGRFLGETDDTVALELG